MALDAASRSSFFAMMIAVPLWLLLAAVWATRLAATVTGGGLRMSAAAWARWLLVPAAMGTAFALSLSDVPFEVRLALSRDAIDQMAADVMAGGSTERGVVGLYIVGHVETTANGIRFVLEDCGLSRHGLAYATDGEPRLTDDNYSPLWTSPLFHPVGANWWLWSEGWD
jgi:hypothetical protein